MSRGPGHVERAITRAFTDNPTQTYTTDELSAIVYPTVAVLAKRHTVAVLRAAERVAKRMGWTSWREEWRHGQFVFYNRFDLHSYAIGRLRADKFRREPLAELEARIAPGGKDHKYVVPDGAWWDHVELHKAEAAGDTARVQELEQKHAAWLEDWGTDESMAAAFEKIELEMAIKQGRQEVADLLAERQQ